jgi:hypothetical protein
MAAAPASPAPTPLGDRRRSAAPAVGPAVQQRVDDDAVTVRRPARRLGLLAGHWDPALGELRKARERPDVPPRRDQVHQRREEKRRRGVRRVLDHGHARAILDVLERELDAGAAERAHPGLELQEPPRPHLLDLRLVPHLQRADVHRVLEPAARRGPAAVRVTDLPRPGHPVGVAARVRQDLEDGVGRRADHTLVARHDSGRRIPHDRSAYQDLDLDHARSSPPAATGRPNLAWYLRLAPPGDTRRSPRPSPASGAGVEFRRPGRRPPPPAAPGRRGRRARSRPGGWRGRRQVARSRRSTTSAAALQHGRHVGQFHGMSGRSSRRVDSVM